VADPSGRASATAAARPSAVAARSLVSGFVDLIALHDLLYFLETSGAESGCQQHHDGGALDIIHFLQAYAASRDHCDGKVRPALALILVVECVQNGLPLLLIECPKE
jgi:hypothetical protein